MSLVLEIEFLSGVCRATREPGNEYPDWPPQPDRVFSALVSAWGVRGEQPQERAALEWLERQPPPVVHASGHTARTTPTVFVPPNDFKTSKAMHTYIRVMPDRRPRQPRCFPVARPDDPLMAFAWSTEPGPVLFEALDAMARDVSYLGHSSSLTRCRFVPSSAVTSRHLAETARRRVYPGRLSELEVAYRENPIRPKICPGAPAFARRISASESIEAPGDWLVLEVVGGKTPDSRAAALVCRLLRQTLMSGYRKIGQGNVIPEEISGHTTDGAPTRNPHIAIVPMMFVGFPHADGHLLGFALVPPRGNNLNQIGGLRAAFEKIAPYDERRERRILTLEGEPLNESLYLATAPLDMRKRSLSFQPYMKPSRIWASVTPIVLDRHLKRRSEVEQQELIANACENSGLPRPRIDQIQIGKYSTIEGMPPARPLRGAPPWTRWKIPQSIASRPLVHAVVDFGQDISGPVLLGAGRFTGLGLCRATGG